MAGEGCEGACGERLSRGDVGDGEGFCFGVTCIGDGEYAEEEPPEDELVCDDGIS